MIELDEDKKFLLAQREKGRRGTMQGKDATTHKKEQKRLKRTQVATQGRAHRVELEKRDVQKLTERVILTSTSGSGSESVTDSDPEVKFPQIGPKKAKIVGTDVAMALDRTGVSSSTSMRILSTAAKQLGHDLEDVVSVSERTIRRTRQKEREKVAKETMDDFDPSGYLTVHWDGKKMSENPGTSSVEYLPVVVSGMKPDQVLGVPKVAGTGAAEAEAVVDLLKKWRLDKTIKCSCFDTTSSNTGVFSGACVKVEEILGRSLLQVACRHHVLEIILAAVFHAVLGPTTGPEVSIFQTFRRQWNTIDTTRYQPGISDRRVLNAVSQHEERVIRFAVLQLQEHQPRSDYKEFLELVILFLGATPPRGEHFRAPGATHNARFMAKAIYCLKMFLFRTQVQLSPSLRAQIREICIFVVNHYVTSWFTAPVSTKAPNNDLTLLQDLLAFPKSSDSRVVLAALDKLSRHMWYLGEHLVALALFDSDVSLETKRNMVSALKERVGQDLHKRRRIVPRVKSDVNSPKGPLVKHLKELPKTLDAYVTQNTMEFFKILELPTDFLEVNPEEWPQNPSYLAAMEVVRNIRVVNDTAERGVALAQRYLGKITRVETQRQALYTVVHKDRQEKPSTSKQGYM